MTLIKLRRGQERSVMESTGEKRRVDTLYPVLAFHSHMCFTQYIDSSVSVRKCVCVCLCEREFQIHTFQHIVPSTGERET